MPAPAAGHGQPRTGTRRAGLAGRLTRGHRGEQAGPLLWAGLLALRVIAAAGLAVDAYVHADLAANYASTGTAISQSTLFLIEAGAASAAALIVLAIGRRAGFAVAALVAASALAAILVYRYVNIGALGPFPNMYEPAWYPEKTTAAVAEAAALGASVAGLLCYQLLRTPGRHHQRTTRSRRSG
jgi:hypothetical protein